MSSIISSRPNPNPNPNPNPKSSQFPTSSSTKSTKTRRKKRNSRNRKKNKNKKLPNWLELPEDVWSLIFSKLYTTHIIENVQNVCMLFRKLCKQPSLYKVIDMTLPDAYMHLTFDANAMTRFAVDRSSGCLVDIYLEYLCDDDTLMYIVERSKNLKHLRLGHYINVSDEGLIEAIKGLPVLEEVEIIICSYSEDTIEAIGRTCPSLKSFSLNDVGSKSYHYLGNEEALAVAKSMPNLRKLQLIGNCMTNHGLKAILDGCPLLESLDLRACFHIDLSGTLGKRCEKIKKLLRPYDSTEDYSHQACTDSEEFPGYNEYDSDGSGVFGFHPGYLDFEDEDDYPDYLDYDDFPPHYFTASGLFFNYESSD